MLRRLVRYKFTDVSEVHAARDRRDGSRSKHLWNVGKLLTDYMAQHSVTK
jgi:hypothetical protein